MFHVHAWGFPYVATLLGIKQVYPGRYLPAALLQLIEKEKVSFSHCVPPIMQMLLSHPTSAAIDLSGWKVLIGGSAMSPTLARAALARGIDLPTPATACPKPVRCCRSRTSPAPICSVRAKSRCCCAARPVCRCRSSICAW